jgi:phosphoglycolate phosphatase
VSAPAALLLLFDVDGTLLLKAYPEHREALNAGIRQVYGIEIPATRIEAAGRTDGSIARSILEHAGVSQDRIAARAELLRAAIVEEYAKRCPPDLKHHVAPGVTELLEGLAAQGRDACRLSLVSGNLEPIAHLKLMRAGLGSFFPRGQGGFGSDSDDRAALPPIARRRAGAAHRPWPRERTIVIGDTPRDIACARADGVHCIAVATGPFAAADLRDADAVVASAHELGDAIRRVSR